jgi:hypothetical protein
MPTKYFNEQNRNKGISHDNSYDTPITTTDYTQYESRNVTRYCPYCQVSLSRLIDSSGLNPSWYCSRCVIEYPDKTKVKSKSRLATTEQSNNNDNPLTSYSPERTLGKDKPDYQGGFKVLSQKGTIRITDYKETNTKRNRRKETYD